MAVAPPDRVSPEPPQLHRRWWRRAFVVGGIVAAVLLLPAITVRRVESRMDPMTGSTRTTVWLFGITSGPQFEVSPLETRLKASGIEWTRSWQFLHRTHRNIFGGTICNEDGAAPPIYELRPVLKEFAAGSTDAELRQFVDLMQSDTAAEQDAAIDAAVAKGFEQLGTPGR